MTLYEEKESNLRASLAGLGRGHAGVENDGRCDERYCVQSHSVTSQRPSLERFCDPGLSSV